MSMVKRLVKISKSHSFFLFGARGTGKSTLLQDEFSEKESLFIDLLDPLMADRLDQNPNELISMIKANSEKKWIIIDEIQKNPSLLDVVHSLSKNKNLYFALTGSSARKLKRAQANLLAGRAFRYVCHPLTHLELGTAFNFEQTLHFGSLPEITELGIEDKKDFLRSYVETYFKEEIVAEQIVRNLKPFKNFLSVAAQMNGKILNIHKISNDVGVDDSTVQTYFEILEDTLVGTLLEPFHKSVRKRQRQGSKFYYFDIGVTRALKKTLDNTLVPQSYEFGDAFEHFLFLELRRLADYFKPDWSFSYLRTKDDAEVDLIIERPGLKTAAIEIKSTSNINQIEKKIFNGFKNLSHDIGNCEAYLLSNDPTEQKIDNVWCLPWQKGLRILGL